MRRIKSKAAGYIVCMALLALCGSVMALPFLSCHDTALPADMTMQAHCAGMLPSTEVHHPASQATTSQHATVPLQTTSDCGFLCQAYCSALNAIEVPAAAATALPFVHTWATPAAVPQAPALPPDALFRPPAQA